MALSAIVSIYLSFHKLCKFLGPFEFKTMVSIKPISLIGQPKHKKPGILKTPLLSTAVPTV